MKLEPFVSKFELITIYETSSNYIVVGSDKEESYFRLLRFNRTINKPHTLSEILYVDPLTYNQKEFHSILNDYNDGNIGGCHKVAVGCAIVGLFKFLDCYYLTIITQKRLVGNIGGNNIYGIENTRTFAIKSPENGDGNAFSKMWRKINQKLNQTSVDIAESRYMGLYQFMDLTKDFFFSYSYDLTNSLQHNYLIRNHVQLESITDKKLKSQDIFMWNFYQFEELSNSIGEIASNYWIVPLIHGSFQQRRFSTLSTTIDLILVARRSRFYAGTRYLKRGVNVHGKVGNDCEIEQIVQKLGFKTTFTSLVQVRGSIPIYWSQETSVTQLKPPIIIHRIDPNYLATQEHFGDLVSRYNLPIIALDLVKHEEKKPREILVGKEYRLALEVINQTMPLGKQIRYIALDYSQLAKSAKSNKLQLDNNTTKSSLAIDDTSTASPMNIGVVAGGNLYDEPMPSMKKSTSTNRIDLFSELDNIAVYSLAETGFFCNASDSIDRLQSWNIGRSYINNDILGLVLQSGILRTNCIDCLDRSNAAQYAIGRKFLTQSLDILGLSSIIQQSSLDSANKMYHELMEMYTELGDQIALQYGGSGAHNKMAASSIPTTNITSSESSRNKSKQGEFLTSIKRYYSNTFTDMMKQDSMNIFLGCYIPQIQSIPLWDLENDYDLHNLILYPNQPIVNKILFYDLVQEIRSLLDELTTSSEFNESLSSSTVSIISTNIKDSLLSRYFIKSIDDQQSIFNIDNTNVMNHIDHISLRIKINKSVKRSEIRRKILSLTKEKINEAIEMWWRLSENKYSSRYPLCHDYANDVKDTNGVKDVKGFKDVKDVKDVKDTKDVMETKDVKDVNDVKDIMDVNDVNDVNDAKDIMDVIDAKDIMDVIDVKDTNDAKDTRDVVFRDHSNKQTRLLVNDNEFEVSDYFDRMFETNVLTNFDDIFSTKCFSPIHLSINPMNTSNLNPQAESMKMNDSKLIDNKLASLTMNDSFTVDSSIKKPLSKVIKGSSNINKTSYSIDMNDHLLFTSNVYHKSFNSIYLTDEVSKSSRSKTYSTTSKSLNRVNLNLSENDETNATMTSSSAFQLSRWIGKAKSMIVGGLSRRDDEGNTDLNGDKLLTNKISSTRVRDRSFDLIETTNMNSNFDSLDIFQPISSSTIIQYRKYCAEADDPFLLLPTSIIPHSNEEALTILKDLESRKQYEYECFLVNESIDIDDVSSMENISADFGISATMKLRNDYTGLLAIDDANLVAFETFSTLNFIENDLISNTSLVERNDLNSSLNVIESNKKMFYDATLKQKTKDRVLTHCRNKNIISGVENAILRQCSKYLQEQTSFAMLIDKHCLSARLSSLTNRQILTRYSSMFCSENLVSDLDLMNYIALDYSFGDASILEEIRYILKRLASLFEKYNKYKTRKTSKVLKSNEDLKYLSVSPLDRILSDREYEGFTVSKNDVYIRSNNPYLVMNEIAANIFSKVHRL